MRQLQSVAFLFLILIFPSTTICQAIRVDAEAGISTSYSMYQVALDNGGYSGLRGNYQLQATLSVPRVLANVGFFLRPAYLFAPEGNQNVADAPRLTMTGWQLVGGATTEFPVGMARLALSAGAGLQWSRFEIRELGIKDIALADDKPTYAVGAAFYFPFFEGVDAKVSYNFTARPKPGIHGLSQRVEYWFTGPTVFHTAAVGLAFSM